MDTAAPTREKLEIVLKDRSLSQDIKELTSAIHRGGQVGDPGTGHSPRNAL